MKNNSKIIIWVLVLAVIVLAYVVIKNNAKAPVVPDGDNGNQTQWNEGILGNKDDLISFSISSGSKVGGVVSYNGVIKGAYFFEANILVSVLDANKNLLKDGNAMATTEWMTSGPVSFGGSIDFTGLPNGPAYILIQNDDPSDGEGGPPKKIFIPIVIDNPVANTYTYKNHGFTIELPIGYVPHEGQSEEGLSITLPDSQLLYVTNATWWATHVFSSDNSYTYITDQKIGSTIFEVYNYTDGIGNTKFYWFKQGNVGYRFNGDTNILKTFKFVGWSQ